MLSFVLQNLQKFVSWPGQEDAEGAEAYYNSVVEAAIKG